MTNHWLDLQHAKVFLIAGSNAAENHVMAMKWVQRAKDKGAKVIHVDPRFTRTSAGADYYARVRPGADIAYLGAIIRYILEERHFDDAYVRAHTNALFLVNDDFAFNDGVFSGYDGEKLKYDNKSWGYVLDEQGLPVKAESLDDPRCVFQKLRQHFSRYTFQIGEEISGIPSAQIREIADLLVNNRPGTILYALGMTQHTTGVQGIRCYGIIQLLLGNVGKVGGGVNALRGEPNVQGACDMSVLHNYLTGYVAAPTHTEPTFEEYTKKIGTFRARFAINTLKSWFGDKAQKENDWGYAWLPKKNAATDYSVFRILETAITGQMKLMYVMGQNPAVTQPNLNLVHDALGKLDMLVVQDLWQTETACFWQRPGSDPKSIRTEVILLPAAYFMEKDGTITGSGRMVQWRYAAVPPPGEARSDLQILDEVFTRVRAKVGNSREEKDAAIVNAVWRYPAENRSEAVLQEINGFNLKTGQPVKGIGELQSDGSTSSGSWIYAGVFGGGTNLSKRRDNRSDPGKLGIYPGFAWTWPGNIHVLYNRASCDTEGRPFDPERAVVWWDAAAGKWTGWDVPDVPSATDGPNTPNGQRAFRMAGEGVGRLFAAPYKQPDASVPGMPRDASGVLGDGPMPEMYEPVESPVRNLLHPEAQANPVLKYPRIKGQQPIGTRDAFPIVLSTASMSEHWCAGSVTRNIPWLNELAPEPWVEVSEGLAKQKGIRHGDRVRVTSARGQVEVKAVVTRRMQPMRIQGQEVHVVWMPYNWGYKGLSTGPSTNVLTIDAGDPNTWCQETKACLVSLERTGGAR